MFKNKYFAPTRILFMLAAVALFVVGTAYAQNFVLSTTGCAKKHCSAGEDDAVNLPTVCPNTSGTGCSVSSTMANRKLVKYAPPSSWPNPAPGKANESDGCSSNSFIVACRSHTSPYLKVFASDGHMLYNSCGGTNPLHPGACPNPDLLRASSTGTPLIAQIGTGVLDNSVVVADDHSVIAFYYSVSGSTVVYSPYITLLQGSCGSLSNCVDSVVPSAYNPTGLLPQGIIYTTAPSGSSTVGLITILFENGPVLLFNPAGLGVSSMSGGYIAGKFLGGTSNTCADGGTSPCFYAGTNSACAVQVTNASGHAVGRIYPVTNQVPTSISGGVIPQSDQYQGRLYAIDVTTTGITVVWDYDFVANGIVGPSRASPMCSPNNGVIFTDYGSWDQQSEYCGQTDIPPNTCSTGVLAILDCSVSPRPAPCSVMGPWLQLYQAPLSGLASDDLSGTNPYQTGNPDTLGGPTANPYINANFAYDVTNQCFWVRPYATATMSCLSDSTNYLDVVEAVNTAFLAANPTTGGGWLQGPNSSWTDIFPASNAPMSTVPSGSNTGAGDSLAIIGEWNGTNKAVLAIDTGVCGQSQTCCTPGLVGATCASSWSANPQIFWWLDLSDPTISAGPAYGQFTILNSQSTGTPCLITFEASTGGIYFLSNPAQQAAGCS